MPGYALALVRVRGEAPDPVVDERTKELIGRLEGVKAWRQNQFEAMEANLRASGIPFQLAPDTPGQPRPQSWAAQERAVDETVVELCWRTTRPAARAGIAPGLMPGPTKEPR